MAISGGAERLLLDTNILLDFVDPQRVAHGDAVALFWYASESEGRANLRVSASSLKDVYYVLCRLYKDESRARALVKRLARDFVRPVDLPAAYIMPALEPSEPDFEDALIGITAYEQGAYVLITRDAKVFSAFPFAHMTAAEYLARVGFDCDEVGY